MLLLKFNLCIIVFPVIYMYNCKYLSIEYTFQFKYSFILQNHYLDFNSNSLSSIETQWKYRNYLNQVTACNNDGESE